MQLEGRLSFLYLPVQTRPLNFSPPLGVHFPLQVLRSKRPFAPVSPCPVNCPLPPPLPILFIHARFLQEAFSDGPLAT